MRPVTRITRASRMEGERAATELMDAVEGMPSHHKTALLSRIVKRLWRVKTGK